MAPSFHSLSDSESSDHETNVSSSSMKCKLKTSKNLTNTLSQSDSSATEDSNVKQLEAHSGKTIETIKAIKSNSAGDHTKFNKKKNDNTMKLQLKALKEKLKYIKPNECLKYITVAIAESLLSNSIFDDVLSILIANEIKYDVVKSDLSSVTWFWQEISEEFSKKYHLILFWHPKKFMDIAQNHHLVDYFLSLLKDKPDHRIYLVLYGTKEFYRNKQMKNEMDNFICELELMTGISHWKFDKPHDLASFILHMSKSVSQEPYRAEKEKLEQEKTFYLQGRSNNCVNIDKDNNGMKRLWIQQMAAFYRLPLDSAKVVCGMYPTPYYLYETYKKLPTIQEKCDLLQDILIGREGVGKRLGPRMSGRIALLFANNNGNLHLSDWK